MPENGEEQQQRTILGQYYDWLFRGNILLVIMKFLWTGMWMTAFLTFQFIEGVFLLVVGGLLWFAAHDYENWQIEWE